MTDDPLKVDPARVVRIGSTETLVDGQIMVNLVAPVPFDSPNFDGLVRAFAVSAANIAGWSASDAEIIADRVVRHIKEDRAAWEAASEEWPRRETDDNLPF